MKHARLVRAMGLLAITACGSSLVDPDSGPCSRTYEFGNTGCAEIEGTVLGSSDQVLPGIIVGPGPPASGGFNTTYVTTDSDGRFRFRITRFAGGPPADGPDTTSLFVHAADPRSAGVNIPATVRDSVLAHVTIAPVGTAPEPTTVTIRLPTP